MKNTAIIRVQGKAELEAQGFPVELLSTGEHCYQMDGLIVKIVVEDEKLDRAETPVQRKTAERQVA